MKQKTSTALILSGAAVFFTGFGLGARDLIKDMREVDSALSQIQDSTELTRLYSLGRKLGVNYGGRVNEVFPEDLNGYAPVRDVFVNSDLRQELENSLREYNSLRTNPTLAEEYSKNNRKRKDVLRNSDKQNFAAGAKFMGGLFGFFVFYGVRMFSPLDKKEDSKKS